MVRHKGRRELQSLYPVLILQIIGITTVQMAVFTLNVCIAIIKRLTEVASFVQVTLHIDISLFYVETSTDTKMCMLSF